MTDEIHVSVCKWADGRPLMLRWTDPVSGKRKTRTSGTTNQRKAERLAGELERELQAGSTLIPSRITWQEFRQRYVAEKVAAMPRVTQVAYGAALDRVERILDPDKLCKLTGPAMSRFVATLQRDGLRPATVSKITRYVKAALRWAERYGYLTKAPRIDVPRTGSRMKGRPLATEEVERMLAAVPKVRPHDPEPWRRLLTGLWLSGLRIGEAVTLDWSEGPFQFDVTGRYPAFRIEAAGQKSGRAEYAPMTPDFATWVLESTPEGARVGPVFPLPSTRADGQVCLTLATRVVSDIGAKTGVVVNPETGKTASAHDLRRSFGTRWARKVMPAVLQRLMRHADIQTTMAFYVGIAAEDVAADLWRNHPADEGVPGQIGNNSGNISTETRAAKGDNFCRNVLQ